MIRTKPTTILFTGYAPVHFVCFKPLYERLVRSPDFEIFLSGGLRSESEGDTETDAKVRVHDARGLYQPFGVPEDWPQENAGDRLVATIAPPPDATAEQIADFQIRLYEALNKLAVSNGGAGLKVDSLGRDVLVNAPVGTGV